MSIYLKTRDIQILEALHTARYMTTDQITTLFWDVSPTAQKDPEQSRLRGCQRRLKQLADHRLVRRIEQPIKIKERQGTKPYIYTLDKNAVPILANLRGIPERDIDWRPKSREENYPFLQHLLDTNEFRIALTRACKTHDRATLLIWEDEKDLKQDPDRVEITTERGKKDTRALIPDAHFVLELKAPDNRTATLHYFVEIDRGTVTLAPTKQERNSWMRKAQRYLTWYSKRTITVTGEDQKKHVISAYQRRYNTAFLRVLVVTTGERRLQNLIAATETIKDQPQHYFWFTTLDQIKTENVLTAPLWLVASKTGEGLQGIIS